MSCVEEALKYRRELGWFIIPVKCESKEDFLNWKEFQKRLPTKKETISWWNKYPDANIGVITGKISGIIVVDIDITTRVKKPVGEKYVLKMIILSGLKLEEVESIGFILILKTFLL